LEDFYHLKLASRLEMITVGEATICVPVKLGLGQFLPKIRGELIDLFGLANSSLKIRGELTDLCP
jgi:hypothetical protein